MTRQRLRNLVLVGILAMLVSSCVNIQGGGKGDSASSGGGSDVVTDQPQGKFWCPDDIPLSKVTRSAAHNTRAACNTARGGANACNGVAVANPNAGCNTHCAATLGCIGKVINASTSTGNTCFPVPDGSGGQDWQYSCVATADCECI